MEDDWTTRFGTPMGFEHLLTAAQRGERWAFDHMYAVWNQPLTAFVAARGAVDVDDVVSEAFLGIFTSIRRFTGSEADFRAWVFRIARNKLADSFRRASRSPATTQLPLGFDPAGGDAELDAIDQLSLDDVTRLFAHLTDDQREVLLLRIIGDLTITQIAKVMGRRPGAIKQHQRRALLRLQDVLEADVPLASLVSDSGG